MVKPNWMNESWKSEHQCSRKENKRINLLNVFCYHSLSLNHIYRYKSKKKKQNTSGRLHNKIWTRISISFGAHCTSAHPQFSSLSSIGSIRLKISDFIVHSIVLWHSTRCGHAIHWMCSFFYRRICNIQSLKIKSRFVSYCMCFPDFIQHAFIHHSYELNWCVRYTFCTK